MEYPTDEEVRAMSNREFADLMRAQAEMIDRSLHLGDRPGSLAQVLSLRL